MKNYTKKELIEKLTKYSTKIKHVPKMMEVARNNQLPPINQFLKTFVTWNNTLKEAKLKIQTVGIYSKNELLSILKDKEKRLGRSPKLEDLRNKKNLPSSQAYFRHFGSWNNALERAGLQINEKKNYKKEELIDLLKKKAEGLRRNPTINDLGKENKMPDSSVYKSKFGSWNNALIETGLKINHTYRKWTKEEIKGWLIRKYKELGKTPGIRDFDKDIKAPGKNTVRKLFGNWTNALREAKIPVKRFWSEEELVGVLQKLYLKLNRTPTREELKEQKECPSLTPFVSKFGSYNAACLRAGLTPNDGRNNKIWQNWEKHCIEMAEALHDEIEVKNDKLVEGVPDIHISNQKLFIDAKTCGYKDFKEQIKRYGKEGHKLEFWCIFKGIENKSNKVNYVYAEELGKRMGKIGRKDLAIKCHQFVRNVFDKTQQVLDKSA